MEGLSGDSNGTRARRPATLDRADAIVVLGCRVLASGLPGSAAARRVATAARAYEGGVAPLVVASGGRRWGQQIEARVLRDGLIGAGVPADAIAVELCSLSTRENALFVSAVLRRLSARRVAVVTCGWHMARALANFEHAGVAAFALPAEGPRVGPMTAARRRIHEIVGGWLDAQGTRGRALSEAACWIA